MGQKIKTHFLALSFPFSFLLFVLFTPKSLFLRHCWFVFFFLFSFLGGLFCQSRLELLRLLNAMTRESVRERKEKGLFKKTASTTTTTSTINFLDGLETPTLYYWITIALYICIISLAR